MIDRDLYIEVMAFLSNSGGTYRNLDNDTCRDVIDALFENQYRLVRDASGNIASFTTWWMIHDADLEMVKNGQRPKDTTGGNIVYVADHAGKGSYPALINYLRDRLGEIDCYWHHRFKHPDKFRYRPSRMGVANV